MALRTVPVHPELTGVPRTHIENFGTVRDGRLFTGIHVGQLPIITYRRLDQSMANGAHPTGTCITARPAAI